MDIPPCKQCGKPAPTPKRVVIDGDVFCGWDCYDKHEESK